MARQAEVTAAALEIMRGEGFEMAKGITIQRSARDGNPRAKRWIDTARRALRAAEKVRTPTPATHGEG